MNAKYIHYGSDKHEELESYFCLEPASLWDVYRNPSQAKVKAYNYCVSDFYETAKELSRENPEGVRGEYTIRSHNSQVFTMIAKYETAHDIIYKLWFPTRTECYIIPSMW